MKSSLVMALLCGAAWSATTVAQAQTTAPAADPSQTPFAPAASPGPASAASQATQSSNVTEVVVTAQKRVERVQDVPIAVTVVSADQLQREQVTALSDLSRTDPALQFAAPGIGVGGGGIIRGIGTAAFSENAEPSVGIVVDGVTQFNTNIDDLFDISRVEILEGPQGTLFGQSVSAGVINITTPTPDPNRFSGYVNTQFSGNGFMGSTFGREVIQGAVNIPVTSNSALRIAAHEDNDYDIQGNTYRKTGDDTNDYGVRARYFWQPLSKLRVNIIGDINNSYTNEGNFTTFRQVQPGSVLAGFLAACGVTATDTNSDSCGSHADTFRFLTYGISGQVDYDLAGDTVTSITSYRKRIQRTQDDIDGFPAVVVPIPIDIFAGKTGRGSDYFTQELRLASPANQFIEYTFGAFYSRYYSFYNSPTVLTTYFGPPNVTKFSTFEQTGISEAAIFGNLTWHLTNQLRLITGGRLTRATTLDNYTDPTEMPDYAGAKTAAENASWRLGLQYDVNRNLMGYATVSRGFKGPQIADNTTANGAYVVKPEIPQAYEVGIKSSVFNGRLAADGDIFYQVVHDYQAQQCTDDLYKGEICVPANASRVITKGVEANVFGKPLPGLTINAGFIYNPAEYPKGYYGTDGTNLGDQQVAFSPKTKVTLSGNYERPINDETDGYLAINAIHYSQQYLYASADPNYLYGAYWDLGGEIGVKLRQGWKLSIYGQNLTNNPVPALIYPSIYAGIIHSGLAYQQFVTAASRRTVGLSIDYKF